MKGNELIREGDQCLLNTYARYPILLVRGEGVRVWDWRSAISGTATPRWSRP
jgi:acetylornithine/succinyldiaminopimelate/putrescine aminotransferase